MRARRGTGARRTGPAAGRVGRVGGAAGAGSRPGGRGSRVSAVRPGCGHTPRLGSRWPAARSGLRSRAPAVGARGVFGYVHFFATRRRCQRSRVSGVTSRWPRNQAGSRRVSAARTARSDRSGLGLPPVRRSRATSCRSARISACRAARVRVSRASQASRRQKIRYGNRGDTRHDHPRADDVASSVVPAPTRVKSPHRPRRAVRRAPRRARADRADTSGSEQQRGARRGEHAGFALVHRAFSRLVSARRCGRSGRCASRRAGTGG